MLLHRAFCEMEGVSSNALYPSGKIATVRHHQGMISAVKGSVVDVYFQADLPPLKQELSAGQAGQVIFEVSSHLNNKTLRAIALNQTQRLARGDPVYDTRHPLLIPVGKNLLGRMLNVFGEVIDNRGVFESEGL